MTFVSCVIVRVVGFFFRTVEFHVMIRKQDLWNDGVFF